MSLGSIPLCASHANTCTKNNTKNVVGEIANSDSFFPTSPDFFFFFLITLTFSIQQMYICFPKGCFAAGTTVRKSENKMENPVVDSC